jgi:hypothetical protein
LAITLIAPLTAAGCGGDNQSGDTTPVAKEASQRQADMYNFMKEKGKVKEPKVKESKVTPKSE